MRATNEPGLFQLLFMGREVHFDDFKVDNEHGDNMQKIQEQFNLVSGRNDLKLLDVTWQTEWR